MGGWGLNVFEEVLVAGLLLVDVNEESVVLLEDGFEGVPLDVVLAVVEQLEPLLPLLCLVLGGDAAVAVPAGVGGAHAGSHQLPL